MQKVVAPWRTIVHQHPLGQAITPKSGRQLLFYGQGLLIAAGLQTKRITRMIIEHGERMTALVIAKLIVPLKVHLPELVRSLLLESLISTSGLLRCIAHPLMTQQDRVYGAFSHWSLASSLDTRFDLACSPAILVAYRQHFPFHG